MKNYLLILISAFCFGGNLLAQDPDPPRLEENNIDDVIAAMTLEEKAKLVVGTGMRFPGRSSGGETQEKVPGAAGRTFEIPRLGIPSIVLADGPAGLRISPIRNNDSTRTYYCTAYPVATLLASSWDTDLVQEIGSAVGNEMLSYGVDILLAPALNIHRNPLCGRNFEYYSEDPLISGKMAAAMVDGVESHGVGTSIKHFVANNTETNRTTLNTLVSERALREIYLKGFEIAVKESQPWTVMSAYNLINDTLASQNYGLLTSVLRKDWGFNGFVMTDWFGGVDPVAQMKAGNDLLMPGRPEQAQSIIEAVSDGSLPVSVLDRNVKRILNIIVETPSFKGFQPSNRPDLEDHARLARQVGAEGMILLKNESHVLPVAGMQGVMAVFGNTSYDIITGGTGSGDVNEAYSVSLIEGLKNAGFSLSEDLAGQYLKYLEEEKAKRPQRRRFFEPQEPIPEMDLESSSIQSIEKIASMALITIGRNSGEGSDRSIEDFNLSEPEKNLISTVSDIFHASGKKVVVILNIGGVIETASWRDQVDAILLAWQAGQETGNAIADVLSGKVNPSGKLTTTFPMTYEEVPSSGTFPGTVLPTQEKEEEQDGRRGFMRSKPARIIYEDDIYVGYRYYDKMKEKTAYEFGFGLSYTAFEYGELKLDQESSSESITASLSITNAGSTAGKEVVQLYIGAPGKIEPKPVKELKGFAKTRLLKPGESQILTFNIDKKDLASFDSNSSSWITEAGEYQVFIGSSSRNIRQTGTFSLNEKRVEEQVSRVLKPIEKLDLLIQ
jgi:beta-glucosidase